jgi:hypothetical protein
VSERTPRERVGFTEERPGVKSSTRLSALVMTAVSALMGVTACVVAIAGIFGENAAMAAGIIAAIAAPAAAFGAHAFGAFKSRTNDETEPSAPPSEEG